MTFQVPEACTLPTAAQPLRATEFAELCGSAMSAQDRLSATHLRLTLVSSADLGTDQLADTVRDLARRETECCSFFDFTVTPSADTVLLDIEVPAEQTAVLDGLSSLATSASPAQSQIESL